MSKDTPKSQPKKSGKKPRKDNKLELHIQELTDDIKRVQADFVNYKRRAEEDRLQAVNIGREAVLRELLPFVDNVERALGNVPKDMEKHDYVKGVRSVAKQLEKTLAKFGVTRIVTVGQEFNPEIMEAVATDDGDGEENIVTEELQSGYLFGERLLRPAMVKVRQ